MVHIKKTKTTLGLPGGPVVKNLVANAGDMGSIPGPGREVPNQWLTILRKKNVHDLYEIEEERVQYKAKTHFCLDKEYRAFSPFCNY